MILATDDQSHVYVIGYATEENLEDAKWIVKRSLNAGNGWEIVDTFCPNLVNNVELYCQANSIVVVDGNIFVAGVAYYFDEEAILQAYALVRYSDDKGNTWQTIDTVFVTNMDFGLIGYPDIDYDPITNSLFYSYGIISSDRETVIYKVRKASLDDGIWTTIDSELGHDLSFQNRFKIRPQDGALFSVGQNSTNGWSVLKSSDQGLSWQVSDSITHNNGITYSTAKSIDFDNDGNGYVLGLISNNTESPNQKGNWIVRKLNYE